MTTIRTVRSERIIMGAFAHGADLLGEITDICRREGVSLGRVEGIGSVSRVHLGYYHQQSREYRYFSMNEPLEISCLTGNISLKSGKTFVHAHLTLADEKGSVVGGHLAPGTIVFAGEYIIDVFNGPVFDREHDPVTGLHLWRDEKAGR